MLECNVRNTNCHRNEKNGLWNNIWLNQHQCSKSTCAFQDSNIFVPRDKEAN